MTERNDSDHTICLIDADQDLARVVPGEDHALARRALSLPRLDVAPGEPIVCPDDDCVGMVLVEGAVWRETHVGPAASMQLLPPGAMVLAPPPPGELLAPHCRSTALTRASLAVLDRRFLLAAARWPRVMHVLHTRLAEQERDLAVQAAIAQLPRIDERLLMLLWHLAEHWGRVAPDGVRVPLRLTHATLGRLAGARRPTVSLALTQLRADGEIERDSDGAWVLLGRPPIAASPADGFLRPPDLFAASAHGAGRDDLSVG